VLIAVIPLASLLWLVISHGAPGLTIGFFTSLPTPVGEPGGGVGNAIVGTFFMVGIASLFALPVGIGAGIFLAEKGDGKLGSIVRFTAEVLSCVPSIVIGIVAYGLVVAHMKRFSALAGGVALALLMLPSLARSTEEFIRLVPSALREASLALGASRWQTLFRVKVPAALSGIIAACMLGMGRAIGETMTVLMATGNARAFQHGFLSSVRTMTANIAIELGEVPYNTTHYYALFLIGFVLFVMTFIVNLLSDLILQKYQEVER
jgi:phosphate transport system permease protein